VYVRLSDPTLDSFNNNEGAKPALLCGAERSSAPRNGGEFDGNVVAVTMKKRLNLLLLTALLIPSLTLPGRNKRRRHERFTPEEAEEPVEFRRRQDGSSTEAAGCAGRLSPKEM